MPSPGPGNGCRQTIASGTPASSPTARTSSLKSNRSGSTSLELEVVGEAADVVMALDVGGPGSSAGLDHIGIEGALDEEFDRVVPGTDVGSDDVPGRLLEDADELPTDDLALLFGVASPPPGR